MPWAGGYKEFKEETGWSSYYENLVLEPPKFPCGQCGAEFATAEDLSVHLFDGHATPRPILMLRGRECGRSRESIIRQTDPGDWKVVNATAAYVNGRKVDLDALGHVLSGKHEGVVAVRLSGERTDQDFEFSFTIADESDLCVVDQRLFELIDSQLLRIDVLDRFIRDTAGATTARLYRDGISSYLFGVLAREGSPESALRDASDGRRAYVAKYDEAVANLGLFDRTPAESICGLVSFHYNQFDLALRKTRSPRVARASRRLATLLAGNELDDRTAITVKGSLDDVLSDIETDRVLQWCCIPLDGSAQEEIEALEAAVGAVEPTDQTKLRLIAAEHHLHRLELDRARQHVSALRHERALDKWVASVHERTKGEIA